MILFPAVDIKNGECVRLRQGLAEQVTVFSRDPAAMAKQWVEQGARWLHLVDLDGAFSGEPVNAALIKTICREAGAPVQLGGGIRDLATAKAYMDAGVSRIIIGTMALEAPEVFGQVCKAFPGKVGVSLDAVDGRLKTKGWVADSGLTVFEVLPRLTDQGTAFLVYTDISRDGMQSGVNLTALAALMGAATLPVIAAGGVTVFDDVVALHALSVSPDTPRGRLQGAITGRAIYEQTLDFKAAVDWLAAKE